MRGKVGEGLSEFISEGSAWKNPPRKPRAENPVWKGDMFSFLTPIEEE